MCHLQGEKLYLATLQAHATQLNVYDRGENEYVTLAVEETPAALFIFPSSSARAVKHKAHCSNGRRRYDGRSCLFFLDHDDCTFSKSAPITNDPMHALGLISTTPPPPHNEQKHTNGKKRVECSTFLDAQVRSVKQSLLRSIPACKTRKEGAT